MSDKYSYYSLKQSMLDELNDREEEILEHEYPNDLVSETVGAYIPPDENLGGDSIFSAIGWSIYDSLSNDANDWLRLAQEETDYRISAQVMANYINQWMENEWGKSDRGDGYSIGEFYHDYLQTAIKAYLIDR